MRSSPFAVPTAIAVALCLGFAAGWWLRDRLVQPERLIETVVIPQSAGPSTAPGPSPPTAAGREPVQNTSSDEQTLRQMLSEHRFREATAFYYETARSDAVKASLLRPVVQDYAQRCLASCDDDTFPALAENWLATFYDDIPILLLLARYQEQQGLPEAAANTLLLARTYALATDQPAVTRSLRELTLRTDERLSEQQRWIELLGYYEYLVAIDFTAPEFELRRALLYWRLGEQARGRELLSGLRATDDGSDPQWSATLEQHLAEAGAVAVTEIAPSADPSNAIPLERRGHGYLVEVTLNDQSTLKLLVDTGASMTALSQESFRRLRRQHFSLLGTRLFNTANGYTRGDIYRASALTLGDERLEDIDIAVLDLGTMDDIDGLLGMNVLRQFHFEIDQSVGAMHISRR